MNFVHDLQKITGYYKFTIWEFTVSYYKYHYINIYYYYYYKYYTDSTSFKYVSS